MSVEASSDDTQAIVVPPLNIAAVYRPAEEETGAEANAGDAPAVATVATDVGLVPVETDASHAPGVASGGEQPRREAPPVLSAKELAEHSYGDAVVSTVGQGFAGLTKSPVGPGPTKAPARNVGERMAEFPTALGYTTSAMQQVSAYPATATATQTAAVGDGASASSGSPLRRSIFATEMTDASFAPPARGMTPAYYALSLLRRQQLDRCVQLATEMLATNPLDQQMWYTKTRAMTMQSWYDDTEVEDEDGVAEVLLEDRGVTTAARPGTSLRSAAQAKRLGTGFGGLPPGSRAGLQSRQGTAGGLPRPGTSLRGFARPGTNSGGSGTVFRSPEDAFVGNRPGTTRPVTTSGRFVRLGTMSMQSQPGGPYIDLDRMDLKKYAQRPSIAKALCDYILYVEHKPRKALELCAEATAQEGFTDWFWKARLGKCYYQLGLYRDAERQFKSSLSHQEKITTMLELGKVYTKLDQPLTALQLFTQGQKSNAVDHHLLLAVARLYDQLQDPDKAVDFYYKVLELDSSNVEAIACIAGKYFTDDQPEMALRLYRRLLQMGINTTELWNNLGLSCFFASQFDIALGCFERAMTLATTDQQRAELWYNISHIGIHTGDTTLAQQALRVTIALDPNHAEAYNNLAVLEIKVKKDYRQAVNLLANATRVSVNLCEALYNVALIHHRKGEFQEAYFMCGRALEVDPDHSHSLELKKMLYDLFVSL